jgi:hypothetical protein
MIPTQIQAMVEQRKEIREMQSWKWKMTMLIITQQSVKTSSKRHKKLWFQWHSINLNSRSFMRQEVSRVSMMRIPWRVEVVNLNKHPTMVNDFKRILIKVIMIIARVKLKSNISNLINLLHLESFLKYKMKSNKLMRTCSRKSQLRILVIMQGRVIQVTNPWRVRKTQTLMSFVLNLKHPSHHFQWVQSPHQ